MLTESGQRRIETFGMMLSLVLCLFLPEYLPKGHCPGREGNRSAAIRPSHTWIVMLLGYEFTLPSFYLPPLSILVHENNRLNAAFVL